MTDDQDSIEEPVSVGGNVTGPAPRATGTARTKMNLAVQHLLGAARLAREIAKIERDHTGQPLSSFIDDVIGASCGAVMLAVASVESFANELFSEGTQNFPSVPEPLLELLWAEYERKSVLEKFEVATRLRSGSALSRGDSPVQALDALVRLRNAIVHFKPEWFGDAPEHEKLSRRLSTYVVHSPWFPNESLFPRAWVGHGSAAWAVRTVTDFAQHVSVVSGLPNPYQPFSARVAP